MTTRIMTKYLILTDKEKHCVLNSRDKELTLPGKDAVAELSILVENLGRVNYGKPHKFHQKKGLWEGPVLVDNLQLDEWKMTPLEFKSSQINR